VERAVHYRVYESDLELEEHYTDTHGYTEINFAAFAMLGRRFCPRIREISKQRIYRISTQRDYGILEPLVSRRDRTIWMDWIIDQPESMGQFYATLKSGHTTASLALKRLYSMSRKNQFYLANRELGRIKKTEFILDYMSQPPLRRQIRRGLLKNDHLHSLARDVAYAKRGRITKRDFYELEKTSISKVISMPKPKELKARKRGECFSTAYTTPSATTGA
jgi:TnpA family transposase